MPNIPYFCPHCGRRMGIDSSFAGKSLQCPFCSKTFVVASQQTSNAAPNAKPSSSAMDTLNSMMPKKGALGLFFSQIFKHHRSEDSEKLFCIGSEETTPHLSEIKAEFPAPWVYSRVLINSVLFFIALWLFFIIDGNPKTFPALVFFGGSIVSISVIILFFELNIRQNVSFFLLSKMVCLGMLFSFVFTSVLYEFLPLDYAWTAGFVEEPAKLIAIVCICRFCKIDTAKYHYKLNGMLFGAAVGFGFDIFENMGYIFETMDGTLFYMRQLNSFCSHITWTAIAGFALWRVKDFGNLDISWKHLQKSEFWLPFLCVMLMHAFHNSEICMKNYMIALAILMVISWGILFRFIREGVDEIHNEQLALHS